MNKFSEFDNKAIELIRKNVSASFLEAAVVFDNKGFVILDVAPQDHAGAKAVYKKALVQTLDINPDSGADYIYDLCCGNYFLPKNLFDVVHCTEVLEHTLNPFIAVDELFHALKPGGYLFGTTPFNFRIHGPSPDCFRFTEAGLRSILCKFDRVTVTPFNTPDRPNMPIQYVWSARKSLEVDNAN